LFALFLLFGASRAGAFDLPPEPDVEFLDHWLPSPVGVEIYFAIDGLMIGYMHSMQNHPRATKVKPGAHWSGVGKEYGTLFLVTGDPEHPRLYMVDRKAIMIKTPFYPTWQPLVMKTWNTKCECPYE